MIGVHQVASRREFLAFIECPYIRYRGQPHWIPPLRSTERARLDTRRHPFFEHAEMALFLALEEGRVSGRIAAIDDRRHNEIHRDNLAAFGFFEAFHEEAARALLAAVEGWARSRGRRAIRGPLSPSMNESAGLLVDGYDADPMVMMPYNPPEYRTYFERAGYAKVKDLFAWIFDLRDKAGMAARYAALVERVRPRQRIVIPRLRLRDFERQLAGFWQIYCRAWEGNWGFVPPTEREFAHLARQLKPIVDPRFVLSVEVDGRPVACAVAVPDINQVLQGAGGRLLPWGLARFLRRRAIISQGRLVLLGVLPEYRQLGLYALLPYELYRRAAGTKYERVECSWVLEDNVDINRPAEVLGARRYKTYRLYEKAL